ncbi:YgaP family membrane protein [Haloarchaeobius sp. HRN-SO-5]|uniref:YgaP family membrane protein n=1 Tax=Haloarchaeobius sp. HRN-SO-5 TaxID=3446118 RepID=UPI003EB88AF0
MEKNVGGYDRLARFVLGPVLILVGLAALGDVLTIAAGTVGVVVAVVALLVGVVLTATAVTQKCPLNSVIGLDTFKASGESAGTTETEQARSKSS